MLYSTVELVTQATLNSHFVFCFCNIIIVFLLIGRAKTSSYPGVSTIDPLPLPVYLNSNTEGDDYEKYDNIELKENSTEGSVPKEQVEEETETVIAEVRAETEAEAEAAEEKTEETEEEEDEEETADEKEDDVDDEELRRRIEEFINKVNREWRKEKLRASCETD